MDFTKLNSESQFDGYLMPCINKLLAQLEKTKYITTLDLMKRYWQIPLAPSSKEKTACAPHLGLFQYMTMPFGLHWSLTTFQRLRDQVLPHHSRFAAAYLDDVVIFSTIGQSHGFCVAITEKGKSQC